jgi:hypothetical protein
MARVGLEPMQDCYQVHLADGHDKMDVVGHDAVEE